LKTVHSIKEDAVVEARSLQSSKTRVQSNKFLLEGEESIRWALSSSCPVLYVFVHEKQLNHPLLETIQLHNIPIYVGSEGILKKITDTTYLVPFIGVAKASTERKPTEDIVVVLDNVKDFGNVGTIVRTAEAFGIHEFVSTEDSLDLFYKKTIDASRGTVFSARLQRFPSAKEAVSALKKNGYQIAVTTLRDSVLQSFANIDPKPIAIVFGNETSGACPEIEKEADIRIQIPMCGSVESLNVGVAAGISLYEMKIKWTLAMLTQKIQNSLGRDLFCASKWIRKLFDKKLKETTSLSADQAILLMILHCEKAVPSSKLALDAGVLPSTKIEDLLQPLIENKWVELSDLGLRLTDKGKETIAQIWCVHELVENLALKGLSQEEKETFRKAIQVLCLNCEEIVPFE
jgi:RNA methyltransferase, TrmH family